MDVLNHYIHRIIPFTQALITAVVGAGIVVLLTRYVARLFADRVNAQVLLLVRTIVLYLGLLIVGVCTLSQMGINVSAFMGAAGIAGIAIGFAAQTTIANIISGIFIVCERSFAIGDVVSCDGVTGSVESVGVLAVVLRTQDGLLVRVPNESFVRGRVMNITYYGTHQLELEASVPVEVNETQIKSILMASLRTIDRIERDPKPKILEHGIALDLPTKRRFMVMKVLCWVKPQDLDDVLDAFIKEAKGRCDSASIELAVKKLS